MKETDVEPSISKTIEIFDQLLKTLGGSDTPGYVIGIAKDNKTIYRRATGLASVEFSLANTPETRMRIGSTTKHFTALSILLLAEEGKLDVDATVDTYLTDLKGPNGKPTLRHLIGHTSGVRDALESTAFFLTEGLFPQIPAGLTHKWSSQFSSVNFPPGERWSYSNYGYLLLSLVIEKVSGLSLAAFFKERLFTPLGMVDSELVPNDMDLSPGLATSHIRLPNGGYRRGIYPCEELVGGGGIVSTVDDMLKWMAHLRQPNRVGNRATWDEMARPAYFNNGLEHDYCYGLKRQMLRGLKVMHHAGSTIGSTCMMMTFPDQALDIIVMANRSDSAPTTIAMKIAEALLGSLMEPAAVAATSAGREALAGHYYSPTTRLVFGIKENEQKLAFSIFGSPEGFLKEKDDGLGNDSTAGQFSLRYQAPQDDDRIEQIEFENCGIRETLTHLADTAPAAGDLASEITGTYLLDDFGQAVEVIIDQGVLYVDLRSRYKPCRMQLEAIARDIFIFTATLAGHPFHGTIVMERIGKAVNGFFLSTSRTRNLHFSRK